jgi:hypothetical protein
MGNVCLIAVLAAQDVCGDGRKANYGGNQYGC